MALHIGIVGLPNVGKSTLFKALTKNPIDIANYPFCTIEPNVGVVTVPDERLNALAALSQSEKIIPTTIEFVDIAGLVKDAHKGEGLGNKFLAHIREVDAIAHVLRAFTDDDITHVAGKSTPEEDDETIALELIMADMATVEKRMKALDGKARTGDKEAARAAELLLRIQNALSAGKRASTVETKEGEQELLKELRLLTMKPELKILNIDEQSPLLHEKTAPGIVAISAKIEAELAELSDDEAVTYRAELGMTHSGLAKLIHESYALLDLITFFTTGPQETRAWTVRKGATAPEAAGVIHSDFQTGFIRAETMHWKELVDAGSELAAKEKGKLRIEGKEYVVCDGDVFHFRFAN